MSTEITVRGSFSAFQPPERGTVNATVAYEGPEMEPVYDRVARDLEILKSSIVPAQGPGHRHLVVGRPTTHLVEPALERQRQAASAGAPRQRRCRGEVQGFHRVVPLGRSTHRRNRGLPPVGVKWALTAKRRETLLADVRTRAVRDAVTRAQQYADALGLGKVEPVASRTRECSTHVPRWRRRPRTCGWRRRGAVAVAELVPEAHRGVSNGRRAVRRRAHGGGAA